MIKQEFEKNSKAAKQIQSDTDILIGIGIGGSIWGKGQQSNF